MNVKVVCQGFDKFFNYGESYAATIDWSSAKVQEKIDGSIIKVWFDGPDCWHVSTNGMIDAYKTDLMNPTEEFKSFGDLFDAAWKNSPYGRGDLIDAFGDREKYTFIFELVSPWNRVVIPYKDIKIYLIGVRDNDTGEEIDPDSLGYHFNRPKVYSFGTFDDAVKNAAMLPYDQEGYVVVDKNWNRIKAKSTSYLAAHHLKNNGNVSPNNVLELIKSGEDKEFIAYFPEYKNHFDAVNKKYTKTIEAILLAVDESKELKKTLSSKKDFATFVLQQDAKIRKYMFAQWDGKNIQAMIDTLDYDDLL